MKIYERLYVGESVNNPEKILKKLAKGSRLLQAYVITMAKNDDQLEIYESRYLTQKYYRNNSPYIIGIASSYDEAVSLVMKIAEESYAVRGDCDLKKFLDKVSI